MTTKVTIEAHCDPKTTHVKVVITGNDSEIEEFFMDNNENQVRYVYNGRVINVKEVPISNECDDQDDEKQTEEKPTEEVQRHRSGNNRGSPPRRI